MKVQKPVPPAAGTRQIPISEPATKIRSRKSIAIPRGDVMPDAQGHVAAPEVRLISTTQMSERSLMPTDSKNATIRMVQEMQILVPPAGPTLHTVDASLVTYTLPAESTATSIGIEKPVAQLQFIEAVGAKCFKNERHKVNIKFLNFCKQGL